MTAATSADDMKVAIDLEKGEFKVVDSWAGATLFEDTRAQRQSVPLNSVRTGNAWSQGHGTRLFACEILRTGRRLVHLLKSIRWRWQASRSPGIGSKFCQAMGRELYAVGRGARAIR